MITISGENVFKLNSVPHDWKTCLLDEAVKIQGGSQPPKKVFRSELEEGYVRLVQIRDYKSDRYLTYVPKNSTKKFCTKDDIMIGRYGPPVFQILRGIEGAYNVALMKAIPLFNMDRNFLFHLLSSPPVQNLVIKNSQRTAGQTGVNLKLLNSCIIPLPPLDQQKKIAAILDAADAYRQKTKALIEKYDELTQSLFLDMFGDPVTNPNGWNEKPLGELGVLKMGGTPSTKNPMYYKNGNINWIKSGDIKGDFISSFPNKITQLGLENSNTKLYSEGTVVIALNGQGKTRGTSGILTQSSCSNQSVVNIDAKNNLNSIFLHFQLKSRYNLLRNLTGDKDRSGLNLNILRNYSIHVPPKEYQNQFAERVQAIEEQKVQAQASLAQAEDLFNSLLQRAFKGELTN